jgi:hypothetical protein
MADHSSLFMAGIWEAWRNPDTGQWLSSFALITTETNDMVGAVHDRMPALLVREQFRLWFGEVPAGPGRIAGRAATVSGRPTRLLAGAWKTPSSCEGRAARAGPVFREPAVKAHG